MSLLSRSSLLMRQGLKRILDHPVQTRRAMGGGHSHPPFTISEWHTNLGEFFSVLAWLWFLHRARIDGPVNLGWRHPWEHDHDDHGHDSSHSSPTATHESWDAFTVKALKMNDDDDEEEDDDSDE